MKDKKTDNTGSWEEELWGTKSLMERTHIKRDTFLTCWCPHCDHLLNEGDKALFEVVDNAGNIAVSKVAAYLNVLEKESSIHIEKDEELTDIRCPHCHTSFIEQGRGCDPEKCERLCGGNDCRIIKIKVSVSNSIKLELINCVRRSCRWYEMNDEDNERLILRDSHEW